MVNSYDVILAQLIMQLDFIHSFITATDYADFVSEIIRLLNIAQILRIFAKQIAFRKCTIKGLFQLVLFFSAIGNKKSKDVEVLEQKKRRQASESIIH